MMRILWAPIAAALCFTVACGGSCPPPRACPACPQARPPAPAPAPRAREEWIDLPVHILFANASSELTRENRLVLDEAVEAVRTRDDVIQVEIRGHTDSRGNNELNRRLSEERATNVKQYLISRGVPDSMLVARGFSEDEPRTSNTAAVDRAQNRRVDFRALVRR